VASTVELLAARRDVELTPFVQTWEPAVASFDRHAAKSEQTFLAEAIRKDISNASSFGRSDLAGHLADFVRYEVRGGSGEAYRALLKDMLRMVVALLQLNQRNSLEYLAPLVGLGRSPRGVTIATLNYDLCIERAAAQLEVPCARGLDAWETEGVVSFPTDGVRLLKLHGSIDWQRAEWRPDTKAGVYGVRRESLIVGPDRSQRGSGNPYLVFGRREKLRPEGPSLELIGELRARLSHARALIVVGYSFADGHVNELIARWCSQGDGRVLVVVDPGFPEQLNRRHPLDFHQRLVSGLQAPPEATGGRLIIIRRAAADVLAELCSADYEALRAQAEGAQRNTG
jgi:hypothetical protein